MKKILILIAIAASAISVPAYAQTMANDQLYKSFGEKAGITVLMNDFLKRLVEDPRTRDHFQIMGAGRIKEQLIEQLCELSGGPCVYTGRDMKSSHAALNIKKSDFHALVEVLQSSMTAQGIPFSSQNQMLALLAPMNRDIITPKN